MSEEMLKGDPMAEEHVGLPLSIRRQMYHHLHTTQNHPVKIVKDLIYSQMAKIPGFLTFDGSPPVVTPEQNFDSLLIPKDHPSRSKSDTYYLSEGRLLRTHTSAHQVDLLRMGHRKFLVTGQVYRKDDIDATHYPIFHQMEGVALMDPGKDPVDDLKETITHVLKGLFPNSPIDFKPDYFPFTEPSWEVVVHRMGELEVAGCGVIHPGVLMNAGLDPGKERGWAFGLGLDRLAMTLFEIPDIRILWSEDSRFLSQFKDKEITVFKPFSSQPACYKDIAFWLEGDYQEKDFLEIVREEAGILVEQVREIDSFKKDGKTSKCYRIVYRSMDRTLRNGEVDEIQECVRHGVSKRLNVKLR